MDKTAEWSFLHDEAEGATWADGLRAIFEYRDVGLTDATNGDYVAHIIRRKKDLADDDVHKWHMHDCTFQFLYVVNGWVTFEYEGVGERTLRKGDCVNQKPRIKHREVACSDDFEVLELVAPADFATHLVDAPG